MIRKAKIDDAVRAQEATQLVDERPGWAGPGPTEPTQVPRAAEAPQPPAVPGPLPLPPALLPRGPMVPDAVSSRPIEEARQTWPPEPMPQAQGIPTRPVPLQVQAPSHAVPLPNAPAQARSERPVISPSDSPAGGAPAVPAVPGMAALIAAAGLHGNNRREELPADPWPRDRESTVPGFPQNPAEELAARLCDELLAREVARSVVAPVPPRPTPWDAVREEEDAAVRMRYELVLEEELRRRERGREKILRFLQETPASDAVSRCIAEKLRRRMLEQQPGHCGYEGL